MEKESGSSPSLSNLLCKESKSCLDDEVVEEKEEVKIINFNNNPFTEKEDEEYIRMLIEKEMSFGIDYSSTKMEDWLKSARLNAIRWIYRASYVLEIPCETAYLSVTYFDRYLLKRGIDRGKDWVIQSLSVACLRLAVKMQEIRIPALSKFRIGFDFENKAIHRMELRVLSSLEWRMGLITPFDFLFYFMAKFSHESQLEAIKSKSAEFLFSMVKEMNSMDHRPSLIAAAAVLAVLNKGLTREMVEQKMKLIPSSCGSLENDQVFSCYNILQSLDSSSTPSSSTNVREDSTFNPDSRTKRKLEFDDDGEKCEKPNMK